MLSPDIQRRLVEARLNEHQYLPKDEIGSHLREKTLIMFVGPSAAGKTFVMEQVKNMDPRFSMVPVFTTREQREDDDPELFRYLPHTDASVSELLDRIADKELVQYAVHPTQGNIYGTELGDYKSEFNLLATFSGAVEQFHQLPFKATSVVSVVPPLAMWKEWFSHRYPEDSPYRQKRLEEASISLDWLLSEEQESSVLFIENVSGNPAQTARNVIEAIVAGRSDDNALDHAFEMREWAKDSLRALGQNNEIS